MTRRRTWLLVHRVNGLLLAAFLTVVGLTGSLLAYRLQLERVFAPALFRLPAHGSKRVDPVLVRERVAAALPSVEVDMLDLSTKPDAPLEFDLTPKPNAQPTGPQLDNEAYADPYTGRVLGSRRYADLRQGWRNVVPFVYALHQRLAIGDAGVTLLGVAALLWTFDCFVGLYLTFPASRRRLPLTQGQRAASWPGRWLPAWRIRLCQGGFKRLYDLHRAAGLWFWLLLLVFAWTGVVFNLPAVADPVLHALGATTSPAFAAAACPAASPAGATDWRHALAGARQRMAEQAAQRHFTIREERFLYFDRAHCLYTYRVRSTLDVDQIGNTQLRWRGDQAAQEFSAPTGASRAETVTTWMEAIHEAQTGGSWLRIVVCLAGLAVALLSVTGVWLFLRKMRGPGRSTAPRRHTRVSS